MARTRKWPNTSGNELEQQVQRAVKIVQRHNLGNTGNTSVTGGAQTTDATSATDEQPGKRRFIQPGALGDALRRNRNQLIPHYITAVLLAFAAMLHQYATRTAAAAPVGVAAVAAVLLAAAALGGLWWLRRTQHLPDGWSVWCGAVVLAACGWTMLGVVVGVGYGTAAVALAADFTVGARWWKHHRHPAPTVPDSTERDVPITDELVALFPARWAESIGCENGVLAGTALSFDQRFDHGIQYTITLVGGKHDLHGVEQLIGKIATGLQHPAARLIVEAHASENPALLSLTVVTTSPITEAVFFTEMPTVRKGFLPVGPYGDGRGDACYRLYKGRRMLNGFVAGSTDSGKSRFLEQVGLLAMHTSPTYVIHVDGMNGASCPALWANAHERYGSREVEAILDRLAGMQEYRERQLQTTGAFRASADYPGVLVIVDEFHRLLTTKEHQARWGALAREFNKCGMGILGADQDATLETWGKGVLRGSLQAGNTIGFRIKERAAGRIVDGGSGFNLYDLPKRSGTGYVFDSDEAGARQAQFRSRWLPDRDDAHPEDEDTGLRTSVRQIPREVTLIEEWFAAAPRVALDPGTDRAGGRSGQQAAPMSESGHDQQPHQTPQPRGDEGASLVPMRLPRIGTPTSSTPASEPGPSVPADVDLTDRQYQALDAVQLGAETPAAIAGQLGCTTRRVQQIMAGLVTAGWVEKTGTGRALRYTRSRKEQPA